MRVQVERVGKRIHVRAVGGYLKALQNRIPGANWANSDKVWTLPLSMDSCRALREHFGADLEIFPELFAWAKTARVAEQRLGEIGRSLSGVELVEVPRRYPGMYAALASRPYQAAAARFIAEGRSVLVADTPGLGKTLETLAGVVESRVPGPYLVAAPQTSLDVVWRREIVGRMHDARVALVGIDRNPKVKRQAILAEAFAGDMRNLWVIVNIEMIQTKSFWVCPECGFSVTASDRPKSSEILCGHDPKKAKTISEHKYPELFDREWGALIMDESQRSLVRKTGLPTQTRAGAKALRLRADGLRIALSGTPMRGKAERLWGTLNWLRPDLYPGFWGWVQRYWNVQVDPMNGSRTIGTFNVDREDAFSAGANGIIIRRTKAEVSPELPPKQYMGTPIDTADPGSPVGVWLEMLPAQNKAYQQMLRMGSAEVKGGTLSAVGILAELTRLKQFASSYGEMVNGANLRSQRDLPDELSTHVGAFKPKLPSNKFDWVVQFLRERSIIDAEDSATGKVVIVSQFTQMLELFREELWERHGVRALSITGKVTGARRAEAERAFNDPDSSVKVLFLNTIAGGVSITLDAADDMVFLDETHVIDDQTQAEDRINNRRPEEKVATRRYWYLKSLGTIDEGIARVNADADREQSHLLDGRRGVAYVREVMEATLRAAK